MITLRLAFAVAVVTATVRPVAAQSILFDTTLANALRHVIVEPRLGALRERPTNRTCEGCEDRPGRIHLVADSPLLTDEWLAAHDYHGSERASTDGIATADFWYDGVHRRIFTRSAVFHDVDDPADVRLGRAPGHYPNPPDFDMLLGEGVTVGQVGFDRWTHDGFSSYFAAMQGTVRDEQTGYLVLATAMGQSGVTRTGSRFAPDDLIRHVRLHPSGQLEVGFETPIDNRPDPLLLVRGAATTEGPLTVQGLGGNVPHACTVRSAASKARDVRVACQPMEIAISGGGRCERGDLKGTRPLQTGASPDGWEVSCGREAIQTAYAICCGQ
jgi:hypothetical protein